MPGKRPPPAPPPPAFTDGFLDQSPDVVYRLDAEGRLLEVNGAVFRLLGYTPAELVARGSDFISLVHPDDLERVALELRLVRAGRAGKDFEVRLRRRAGEGAEADHVWFSNVTWPVRDGAGAVTGYGGIARDVTRTVRTATSLARRNVELIAVNSIALSTQSGFDVATRLANFASAMKGAFDLEAAAGYFAVRALPGGPATVLDDAGLGLEATVAGPAFHPCLAGRIEIFRADRNPPPDCPVAARAFAAGFRSLLAMPLSAHDLGEGALFFLSRDAEAFESLPFVLMSTLRMQLSVSLENAVRYLLESRRNQVISILKETASALINAGDIGEVLNVTHYQARQYLALDRLSIAFMTAPDAVAVRASAASPPLPRDGATCGIAEPGSTLVATLGLGGPHYVPDLSADPATAASAALRVAGLRTRFDVPIPLSPETRGVVRFAARRADAFHPEEREFLCDLARIVSLAVVNVALKDELRRSTAVAREMASELQTFVYSVSHDLKTPLFSILGLAGILKEETAADDPRTAYLDRMLANATRMDSQIKELVTLAKIGTYLPSPEAVDLGLLARDAVAALERRIRERGARVEIAPGMPGLVADRALLGRILENLLDNAIKYVPAGRVPQVRVSAERVARDGRRAVLLSVADNGCGIEAKDRERVFALFSRLRTLPDIDGTGAGLSIVKRMAERLGGSVDFESEPGSGTRFLVELPG